MKNNIPTPARAIAMIVVEAPLERGGGVQKRQLRGGNGGFWLALLGACLGASLRCHCAATTMLAFLPRWLYGNDVSVTMLLRCYCVSGKRALLRACFDSSQNKRGGGIFMPLGAASMGSY